MVEVLDRPFDSGLCLLQPFPRAFLLLCDGLFSSGFFLNGAGQVNSRLDNHVLCQFDGPPHGVMVVRLPMRTGPGKPAQGVAEGQEAVVFVHQDDSVAGVGVVGGLPG